ncbi:MAG: GntR family transcriptional regulator [Pseudoxanthomonas sp.]
MLDLTQQANAGQAMSLRAYALLKSRITSGELAGGAEIDDRLIAAELGSSRTPVREGLLRLQSEGLVNIIPRHAIRVAPISIDDMAHIYELLTALEVFAVELIARRKPASSELGVLHEAVAAMRRGPTSVEPKAWIDADERFHRGLLSLSNNPRIAEVGISYRDRGLRGHVIALRLRPHRENSIRAHAELVEALIQGRVALARRNHQQQRERAGTELIESLTRAGLVQF